MSAPVTYRKCHEVSFNQKGLNISLRNRTHSIDGAVASESGVSNGKRTLVDVDGTSILKSRVQIPAPPQFEDSSRKLRRLRTWSLKAAQNSLTELGALLLLNVVSLMVREPSLT